MVSFLRPWLFLFIIILGEMLLTEIKIIIKNIENNTKYQDGFDNTNVFFETKTVKP